MTRKMAREPKTVSDIEQLPATPIAPSKISLVLDLLRREQGASLDEMVEVTSWLPHTTRAALTGLKKKGHVIAKAKVDGVTRYTIVAVASA
jgi:hypothetical protein